MPIILVFNTLDSSGTGGGHSNDLKVTCILPLFRCISDALTNTGANRRYTKSYLYD